MAISTTNKNNMISAAAAMDTAIANLATAYTNFLSAQQAALDAATGRDTEIIDRATGIARLRAMVPGRMRSAGIITLFEGRPAAAGSVSSIETVVTNLLG